MANDAHHSKGPNLKVSRAVAACARCRNAKTKCDGNFPACSTCVKAGKADECAASGDNFAKGKERSYPAFLEARLAKLQRKVAVARQAQANSLVPSSIPHFDAHAGSSAARPRSLVQNGKSRQDDGHVDELVGSFGHLAINASARDYQGFKSLMSVARVTLWAITGNSPVDCALHPLPSREDATSLGRDYLNNIFVVLPVIENSAFWTSMEAVYFPGQPPIATPYNHYIVRMVLANALISRSEQFNDQWYRSAGDQLNSALYHVEHVFRPDNIASIQAMLLLVEYSRYDPMRLDNWTLVGAVSRAMIDLGLHQDPPKAAFTSREELEARRRVFMCVYSMDRLTSMSLHRSFSFSDASTDVDVSASLVGVSSPGSNLHASIWIQPYDYGYRHFEIRQVQSAFYQDLFQTGGPPLEDPYIYVWEKWHKANDWFESLPRSRSRPLVRLTELERLATHIQLLTPSPKVPLICELAQNLIFEYGLQYTADCQSAAYDSTVSASLSYTSGLRIRKTASMILNNFKDHRQRLLSGRSPVVEGHEAVNAPPFPYPERSDNRERMLGFLSQMTQTLQIFSHRFALNEWHDTWRIEAAPVEKSLLAQPYLTA